jgi:hypothetical protein
LGDFEQRIGAAGHSNLARERFDAFVIRKQRNAHVGQWRRRFTPFALLIALVAWTASASKPFATGPIAAFVTALRWTGTASIAALGSAGTIAAAATFTGRTSAIAPRATAVITTTFGPVVSAFVFGVKIGRSWFLCPCRQEKLFQVQLVFWWGAHYFSPSDQHGMGSGGLQAPDKP